MDLENLVRNAKVKGLDLLGTGDFTHPLWLKELKSVLTDENNNGLFTTAVNSKSDVHFLLTGEVCTNFKFEGKAKRIHHLLLSPSFEHVDQINDRLAGYGDLEQDGRPNLDMSAVELVEEVLGISRMNEVIPAHVWTPWFSLFGAFSGFDSVADCYQEMSDEIHALETGLSSDPPMNWRLSELDRYVLVSNSDSHSPWDWRLGREANLFETVEPTYKLLINSIRRNDRSVLKGTIEVDPAYGKYHWSGHRKCDFSVPPEKAVELNGLCPICRKRMTKGVDQRVLELSDRPSGFIPKDHIPFKHLLPLSEIIASVTGSSSLYNPSVKKIHGRLVPNLGTEFQVLLYSNRENISGLVGPEIANAILRVRQDKVEVIPGYDGVYGQLVIATMDDEDVAGKKQSGRETSETIKDDFNPSLENYL